jgi:hypothetical protein
LEHYVEDFTGPRYFTIGTHHDSNRRSAWRKMGRSGSGDEENKTKEFALTTDEPCVNTWYDKDDIIWTNEELHGPGALPLEGSSTSSSSNASEPAIN